MSLQRTYDYWSKVFGHPLAKLTASPLLVQHQSIEGYHDFRGYHSIYALQHKGVLALSVAPELLEDVRELLRGVGHLDLEALAILVLPLSLRIVGPAAQAYLGPYSFRPKGMEKARALSQNDSTAVADLQRACDPVVWSHSGISPQDDGLVGCFEGDRLVSVAKLLPWSPGVTNVGVVSHPDFHGRGFGAAAVSAVVNPALEADTLVFYQTLKSNLAALRLASKLGFETFGETLSVRFKPESQARV